MYSYYVPGARFTQVFIKICYLMHLTLHYIILYYNRAYDRSTRLFGEEKANSKCWGKMFPWFNAGEYIISHLEVRGLSWLVGNLGE